jgi:RimJ/RimL family protein N-acetyltransferase
MEIRACTPSDVPALAQMNRMLIEDERAENDMTLPQLEARMAGFLAGEYRAFLFGAAGEEIGFICREKRRSGFGRAAFQALLQHLNTRTIDIDVLVWNEAGRAFWQSLGFRERYVSMRYRTR